MSLTQVQGPKALGHLLLLSQATSRELDGKQGAGWEAGLMGLEPAPTWDLGTFKVRASANRLLHQSQEMVF